MRRCGNCDELVSTYEQESYNCNNCGRSVKRGFINDHGDQDKCRQSDIIVSCKGCKHLQRSATSEDFHASFCKQDFENSSTACKEGSLEMWKFTCIPMCLSKNVIKGRYPTRRGKCKHYEKLKYCDTCIKEYIKEIKKTRMSELEKLEKEIDEKKKLLEERKLKLKVPDGVKLSEEFDHYIFEHEDFSLRERLTMKKFHSIANTIFIKNPTNFLTKICGLNEEKEIDEFTKREYRLALLYVSAIKKHRSSFILEKKKKELEKLEKKLAITETRRKKKRPKRCYQCQTKLRKKAIYCHSCGWEIKAIKDTSQY